MRKLSFLVMAFVFCAASFIQVGYANEEAEAVNAVGKYVWIRGKKKIPGELKATFTATGKDKWDVVFNFNFRKKPHVYIGTATGDLMKGEVNGTVYNEGKKREFVFKVVSKDGKMSGNTWETTNKKKKKETGTVEINVTK